MRRKNCIEIIFKCLEKKSRRSWKKKYFKVANVRKNLRKERKFLKIIFEIFKIIFSENKILEIFKKLFKK